MKKVLLFEEYLNENSAWKKANKKAEDLFGELGIASLDDSQLADIIDIEAADKLADKMFGEFGFLSLSEEDMEKLLTKNPKLLKEAIELVHVYNDGGELQGTGELVKTKGNKSLIRWDGSNEEWIDSKLVKLVESINEGKGWAKLMKAVKVGSKSGPWSIVSIEGGKVVNQELVNVMDAIPAHYEEVKKRFPNAKMSIEDNEGMSVYNEALVNEHTSQELKEAYKRPESKVAGKYEIIIGKDPVVITKIAGFEREGDSTDSLYLMDDDELKPIVGSFIVKNSDMPKLEKGTQVKCKTSKGEDAKIKRIGDL